MFHKNITHTAATTTISIVSVTDEVLINEGLLYKNFFLYVDECFPTCLTCNGPSYVTNIIINLNLFNFKIEIMFNMSCQFKIC